MIKNLRWGAVGLLVTIISFGFIGTLFAQEACGTINKLDGSVEEIEDCDNPFLASEDSPFTLMIAGVVIAEGSSYEIPINITQDILLQADNSIDVDSFSVLKSIGSGFQEIEVDTIDPEVQYQTLFEEAGTYTVVLNWDIELVTYDSQSLWQKLFAFLVPIARADVYPFSEIYTRTFTVTEPVAEAPCGSIIYDTYSEPIEDCDNPLNAGTQNESLLATFAGTDIIAGESYEFLNQSSLFTLSGIDSEANAIQTILYRHSGEDYIVESYGTDEFTFATTGTYSLFVQEDNLIVGDSRFQQLREFFFPTVYAAVGDRTVITFEVVEESAVPNPEGVSNILFLPGIQTSRLYSRDEGAEEKLWEPGSNGDVERLAMTESGESVENIYTKDVIEEIGGIALGSNIYKGFLDFLRNIDGTFAGPIVETFPYDWRRDVFDIVQNGTMLENGNFARPTTTVEVLAGLSPTGKTTIIAHSNGGLLAKAIMLELERVGKTDLVDKIIFIGTPHLGTPKAIATVLHGYDQQDNFGGIFIDDVVARDVMRNFPGVYGLLPSKAYLDATNYPLVFFDDSDSTQSFRDAYGFGVSNITEFTDFMNGAEDPDARSSVSPYAINEPTQANSMMLEEAQVAHDILLDTWVAPEGVEVSEIIGTGLLTVKALEYREVTERACPVVCELTTMLKPYAQLTKYGDETVVSVSASGVQGNKDSYYLNLFEANPVFGFKNTHANLTESNEVQELIERVINSTSTENIDYISVSEPEFLSTYDIESIDSPVRIYVKDEDGNITGVVYENGERVVKKDIPDSFYFEFGDTKYVAVPSGIKRETTLIGEAYGGYTLRVSMLGGNDEQEVLHEIVNASTTPDMVATYTKDGVEYSTVTTDLDGDGEVDTETTLDGEVIESVTYKTLYVAIKALELRRYQERILLRITKVAERYSKKADTKPKYKKKEKRVLNKLKKVIRFYKRWRLITKEERDELLVIIKELKNK